MAVAVREAGKTWRRRVAEVREAVDFLPLLRRRARASSRRRQLPGPTGERNDMRCTGAASSLHQPVELPAGDLHRPGRGGAGGRQQR